MAKRVFLKPLPRIENHKDEDHQKENESNPLSHHTFVWNKIFRNVLSFYKLPSFHFLP